MTEPGIYVGLSMAEYLEIDALSASPARIALDECPRAGWYASRLNPEREQENGEHLDIGSVAHCILLEGSAAAVSVIDPALYRSKPTKANPEGAIPKGWTNDAIREARDNARAAGLYPILADNMREVDAMVTVAQAFIESLRHTEPAIWNAFQPGGGQSEVTIVWQEGETLCKIRTDRLANDYSVCVNYKTSGASVEPDHVARAGLLNMGYAFGGAWYQRGIKAATREDCAHVWLCQETAPPYLCSLVGMDPTWEAYAAAKVRAALALWQRCAKSGDWPGYPARVCYPELPPWESAKLEAQFVEGGIPYDVSALFERTDGK